MALIEITGAAGRQRAIAEPDAIGALRMNHDTPAYGLWSLVIVNSAIFTLRANVAPGSGLGGG